MLAGALDCQFRRAHRRLQCRVQRKKLERYEQLLCSNFLRWGAIATQHDDSVSLCKCQRHVYLAQRNV